MNRRHLHRISTVLRRTRWDFSLLPYAANKLHALLLRLFRSKSVAYPSNVMLELSNQCNLHCTTCAREYAYGRSMDRGFMPPQRAKSIIDQLLPRLDSIGLTGMGETFLYPHLPEIARYIRQKKPSVVISLSTNAQVPHFVEQAEALLPYVDAIQVSTDGTGAVYEQVRRGARFARLEENLRALLPRARAAGVDVMLNTVITKETAPQMAALVEFAHAVGVPYLNFTYFNLVAATELDASYYAYFRSPEFLRLKAGAEEAARRCPGVEVTGLGFPGRPGFRKCPFPWSHFYITWDGYLVPCCAKPFPKELNFGNVADGKVIDLLNSFNYRSFRALHRKNQAPPFCRNCHFLEL